MKDYSKYQMSFGDQMKILLVALGCSGMVAFLFYHSVWGMVVFPLLYIFIKKRQIKQGLRRQQAELGEQFMNGLQVLEASLQAGFSMENAWKEVEKETGLLYTDKSVFYQELRSINRTASYNMPIEKLFLEFAYRSGVEDIISFAEIMDYGKRSGGNWRSIITDTVLRMIERYETKKEIEVMLAAKRMEQQIMNVIPLGLLLFLQFSSWDYMEVLYENVFGAIVMTVCLVVYGVAILLSEKIMSIQV